MDNLEFLDGAEAPNEVVQPDEVKIETPPVQEAAPVVETPVETPKEAEPPKPEVPPGFVPYNALKEARDEAARHKEELKRLRGEQPQQQVPDVFEDPDAFTEHNRQLAAQMSLNTKLELSEDMARDKFGDQVVDSARDWALEKFRTSPAFQQEALTHRNPYRFVVESYQRDQVFSSVAPDEIEQFKAWKAQQASLAATPAAPAAQPQPTPTPSLASAVSAGGVQHTAVGDGVAFHDMFGT